ncbi:MAG: hypothetical protein ACRENE_09930 [Polyangiaceae bacterium]
MGLAAAGVVTSISPSGSAREVRTTFSFVVTVDERVWPYNDSVTQDVPVLLPQGSPWQCVRRRLALPGDGAARGAIQCSSDGGKTTISASAACGTEDEEHHNSVTLTGGGATILLTANCRTSVYKGIDFPTYDWPGF